jgi:hypothetical protein
MALMADELDDASAAAAWLPSGAYVSSTGRA